MSKCPNCNSNISCGCQVKYSTSGVRGCTNCINKLNNKTSTSVKPKIWDFSIQKQIK